MNEIDPALAIETRLAHEANNFEPEFYVPITDEALDARITDALGMTEFAPTPEVREAIEGFYTEHYTLATCISESLGSVEERGELTALDDEAPHAIKKQSEMLARARQGYEENPEDNEKITKLIQQAATTLSMTFTESSVGITTVGDEEIAIRKKLGDQVLAFAQKHDMLWMFDGGAGGNRAKGFVTDMSTDKTTRFTHELDDEQLKIIDNRPDIEQVEGRTQFNCDPYGNGKLAMEIRLSDYMAGGPVERAKKTFWNDVRDASHLEFHGSGIAGKSMMDGLMSRNEQIRNTGEYSAGTIRDQSGEHHANVPKFSEYAPSGEYTTYIEETHRQDGVKSPGTYGIPIADIIEVAPFARNAEFATVPVKKEALNDMRARVGIPIVDKKIGAGATENIGSSPEYSLQRAFFARPEESTGIAPDEYRIELTGMGKSGSDPASSTRVLFNYDKGFSDTHWFIPRGYQFPANYILSLDGSGDNAGVIKEAQERIAEYPKFKDKFVIPLRRGVFSFVPEESDHKDYPRAEGRTYTQIAKKSGGIALASL
jgi:hypothetical protein